VIKIRKTPFIRIEIGWTNKVDNIMIRKIFKQKNKNSKLDSFIKKYNIPREYLSINRKSITKGVLIGLFWGFIPMPMQMLAVVAMTPFFKFNVPIAISMVWLSNPLTMPFMYYMEYQTGNFLLGTEGVNDIEYTLDWLYHNFWDIFKPLYLGTAVYSIGVSTIIYYIINFLWIISMRNERPKKFRKIKLWF